MYEITHVIVSSYILMLLKFVFGLITITECSDDLHIKDL